MPNLRLLSGVYKGVTETDRQRLRLIFNQDAELYDRARPGYPSESLAELARLVPLEGCRVLEIGCGTGQVTLPLAQRGCAITALDIGANLAALAREKLAPYAAARVIVGAFEDWRLPDQPFDLVASATAFHWIDPAIRVEKAAQHCILAAPWPFSSPITLPAAVTSSLPRCKPATSAGPPRWWRNSGCRRPPRSSPKPKRSIGQAVLGR
jgi:SAM-dependent methyltransferase